MLVIPAYPSSIIESLEPVGWHLSHHSAASSTHRRVRPAFFAGFFTAWTLHDEYPTALQDARMSDIKWRSRL
jgi:hypothetical protein